MSEKIPDTLNEKSDAPAHVGLTSRGISEGAFAPGDGDRNVIDVDADVPNVFLEVIHRVMSAVLFCGKLILLQDEDSYLFTENL